MKSLVLIVCAAIMISGCGKKDGSVAKSDYLVYVTTSSYFTGDIPPKFRLSGTDIETKDNMGPVNSFYNVSLPKGKTTTITGTVYDGTNRGLYMRIYKKVPDNSLSAANTVFEMSGLNEISATFTVK